MRTFAGILLLGLCSLSLYSQNINPSQNKVFRFNEVMRIELTMDENDKTALWDMEDIYSDTYYPATVRIKNSKLDTTLTNVGVRLRGNTSRNKIKKSIKLDFTEFGGSKFYNNKKFNLKAEVNDPSMMREFLSLYLYRNYGVPASRAHFVELRVNNEYMGLYLNVEQIDDEFVDRRYADNEAGNLFKCLYPATLEKNGDIENNDVYVIKMHRDENDRTRLKALIDSLNIANSSTYKAKFDPIFNTDGYIKQLAMEAVLAHWDGYTRNANNYYLYEDSISNKTQFIPYDVDNTWGIDWGFVDYENETAADWPGGNYVSTPLTDKVMSVSEYEEQYFRHIVTITENFFNETFMLPLFDSIRKLIDPFVKADSYYSADNGFTYNDFKISVDNAWGNHVYYGLREFLSLRRTKILNGIGEHASFGPVIFNDTIKSLYLTVPEFDPGSSTVNNSFASGNFMIFPNPVSENYFYVKSIDQNQAVKVYDYLGRETPVRITESGNAFRVEFHRLVSPGLYILRTSNTSQSFIVVD